MFRVHTVATPSMLELQHEVQEKSGEEIKVSVLKLRIPFSHTHTHTPGKDFNKRNALAEFFLDKSGQDKKCY